MSFVPTLIQLSPEWNRNIYLPPQIILSLSTSNHLQENKIHNNDTHNNDNNVTDYTVNSKIDSNILYDLNDNSYDRYLGMGYSRFRNAELYIEQDFVVHYYTLGIYIFQ